MQALTVRRPYADLLVLGRKPAEYRTWFERGRSGPTLIHAGLSRAWRHRFAWFDVPAPPADDRGWGAIIGLVDVVAVFHVQLLAAVLQARPDLNYLLRVPLEGPYCYIVQRPWRFCQPIRWTGQQRLFDVPDEVFADALCQDLAGHVHVGWQYAEAVSAQPAALSQTEGGRS